MFMQIEKKDLKEIASIGNNTMTKLVKDENAIMDVIVKICNALNVLWMKL